jgi:alpha-glucuronidase
MIRSRYDGKYLPNVHIAGKITALDFETVEPINPLDGLLKQTHYGAEVVVGKSFTMSWLQAWVDWLNFDNGRGSTSTSSSRLLNKESIDSMVGVLMMGTDPSWYTQPLNLVNLYGYGRLGWNTSMTKDDIYQEWLGLTFATMDEGHKPAATATMRKMLLSSEKIATLLGIYHGYRGVWYELEGDGSFRSPNSVKHVLTHDGIGTVETAANELFEKTGYSPAVQKLYKNHTDPRTEEVLLEFGTFKPSYRLSNGKTLVEDMIDRPKQGAQDAAALVTAWQGIESSVRTIDGGHAYFNQTLMELQAFAVQATQQSAKIAVAVGKIAKA